MDKNLVEISIVMPCYNVESYVEQALESILNQDFKNYEVIAIDDGSKDDTLKKLNEFKKKHIDLNLKIYSDSNHGQGYQRNKALGYALGKYIYFMDSDDLLRKTCLGCIYQYAEKSNLDILYFGADSFYETAELEEKFPYYRELYHRKKQYKDIYTGKELFIKFEEAGDVIVGPCMQLINKNFLIENNLKFPDLPVLEDNLFYFRTIMCATKVQCITERLYLRRVRENSLITTPRNKERFMSYKDIIEELALSLKCEEDGRLQKAIWKRIRAMFRNVYREYQKLSPEELTKICQDNINDTEFLLALSLYEHINEFQRKKVLDEKDILQSEKIQLQTIKETLSNKFEESENDREEKEKVISNLEREKNKLEGRLEKKKRKISSLKVALEREKEEKEIARTELDKWKNRKIIRLIRKIDRIIEKIKRKKKC